MKFDHKAIQGMWAWPQPTSTTCIDDFAEGLKRLYEEGESRRGDDIRLPNDWQLPTTVVRPATIHEEGSLLLPP